MATSWFLENHPEWFSANSPVLVAQGDQLPPQTAVAGPIPAEARSGEGYTPASNDWFQHNATERFARSFNSAVGIPESVQDKPSEALEGLKLAVTHPSLLASSLGEMGKGIWQGMSDTGQKAIDAWKGGHPLDAAGYAIESGIPIMGPMLAHSGEQVASGDVAGGLGTMAGIVGPMLVGNPRVRANVAEAAKAGTTAIAREAVKNPLVREAINATSPGIIEGMGDTLRDSGEKGVGDKSPQLKATPAGAKIHEATGLPLNPDGTVTLYHETDSENLASIRKQGLSGQKGRPLYLATDVAPDGKLMTYAEKWKRGNRGLRVDVDPSDLKEDPEFQRLMPGSSWFTRQTVPWDKITVVKPFKPLKVEPSDSLPPPAKGGNWFEENKPK